MRRTVWLLLLTACASERSKPSKSYRYEVLADKPIVYLEFPDGAETRGGVTKSVPSASPALGTAVRLDGQSGRIVVALRPEFRKFGAFTIELWFNTDSAERGDLVNYKGQEGYNDFGIFANIGGEGDVSTYEALQHRAVAHGVAVGRWHHIAATRDDKMAIALYVDGSLRANAQGEMPWDFDAPLLIGCNHFEGDVDHVTFPFSGCIDEVAVYDHALSADRVKAHFDAADLVIGELQSPVPPPIPVRLGAHSAVTPVPRQEPWWMERHAAMLDRVKREPCGMLFIGDSITEAWDGAGGETWKKLYAPRNAVVLGIGGDRTQHVLWRLQDGLLNYIGGWPDPPKVAVVMIGTNNSNGDDNTPEEIADGIVAIVQLLREHLPETKVLLLDIFPRGQAPNAQREKCAKASALARRVADGRRVVALDIGGRFLNAYGFIHPDLMPDFLHLSPRGYEIWADAMEPTLEEMMR